MSGGFLSAPAAGTSQIRPVDVRPEFFAGDSAAGGFFDLGAALGGHWSNALRPLMHHARRHANQFGEVGLRSRFEVLIQFHVAILALLFILCQ